MSNDLNHRLQIIINRSVQGAREVVVAERTTFDHSGTRTCDPLINPGR